MLTKKRIFADVWVEFQKFSYRHRTFLRIISVLTFYQFVKMAQRGVQALLAWTFAVCIFVHSGKRSTLDH